MSGPDLSDYVEVADRIATFRDKHPQGSFQVRFVEVPPPFNEQFIAVEARAYRGPDDELPGIDIAWEPVPGKTSFTKDSEAMNASTSAVGRAIVYALAADTHKGIASANEVRARTNGEATEKKTEPSPKQLDFLDTLLKKAGVESEDRANARLWALENLTGGKEGTASKAIDEVMSGGDEAVSRLVKTMLEWQAKGSDVPAETEGLPA